MQSLYQYLLTISSISSDDQDLLDAIRSKLWPLGNDVTFVPGHGPVSTFGQERLTNPYVADQLFK